MEKEKNDIIIVDLNNEPEEMMQCGNNYCDQTNG